jgi:hypothetical protein
MIRIDDEDDRFADDFEVRIPRDSSKRYKSLCDGYIVDNRGRIRGEARRYDPYARFGEIMLYDIDAFGFVSGYVSKNWQVMSEEDMLVDRRLARKIYGTKYNVWKRYNILELKEKYDMENSNHRQDFEKFCRKQYMQLNE